MDVKKKWWRNDVCVNQWEVLSHVHMGKAKHAGKTSTRKAGKDICQVWCKPKIYWKVNSNSRIQVLKHSN